MDYYIEIYKWKRGGFSIYYGYHEDVQAFEFDLYLETIGM